MKAILLIFLYLLTVAETTRKFTSPDVRLPRDYLEEENEDDDDDDDDDENTPNVEQSPETERTSVSQTDDGVDLLEKTMQNLQEKVQFTSTEEEEEEEESSQEEQALESRFGPHYLIPFGQSHSEELPLHESYKADLPERNIARENKEYCKVHVVLVTSSVTFGCIYFFLVCCWIAVIRHRLK